MKRTDATPAEKAMMQLSRETLEGLHMTGLIKLIKQSTIAN